MSPAIGTQAFRAAAGLFATGVAVVVSESGGQVRGMTVNSVTSVSLDPPLMLFCANRRAHIAQDLPALRRFTINVLRREQQDLSSWFAGAWKQPEAPPFRFLPSPAGPCLADSLAVIGCETHQLIEAGDHWLVLGRVVWLQRADPPHQPLVFLAGQYRGLDPQVALPVPEFTP